MDSWKIVINISDIWQKYDQNWIFNNILEELIPRLKTYSQEIGENFGEYAQTQYDEIVDQLGRSDNAPNFDLNFNDLCEWVIDYDINIKIR